MKTREIKLAFFALFIIAASMLFVGCNEDLSYDKSTNEPPVVGSFSPKEGPRFTEISVKGSNLHRVTSAYIGDQEISIKTRVTNTELILIADGDVDGKMRLVSTYDTETLETTTTDNFTYRFVAPEINAAQMASSIEVGTSALIMGENMLAVESVFITDASNPSSSTGVSATILSKTNSEVLLTVPYVEFSAANFYVSYFDGTAVVNAAIVDKSVDVVVYNPTVTSYSGTEVSEGGLLEIDGTYLDRVNKVSIGDIDVVITQKTADVLKVMIPIDAYPDGWNRGLNVKLDYFESAATLDGLPTVDVFVPEIYLGSDYITGRGRTPYTGFSAGEWYKSFYQFKAGSSFSNPMWASNVDKVSGDLIASGASGTTTTDNNVINKENVSEEDYYSVEPWVYFYGNPPAFYGGAARSNLLKNYYLGDKPLGNLVSGTVAGTPVLMFLQMFPYSTDAAAVAARPAIESAVTAVRNDNLERINAGNFPIDRTLQTVGGIPLMKSDGTSALLDNIDNGKWTTGMVHGSIDYDLQAGDKDGVVMVIYYDYENGYDPLDPTKGIYKIGFIHATGLAFQTAPGDSDPRGSAVWIDTYWQKRPY